MIKGAEKFQKSIRNEVGEASLKNDLQEMRLGFKKIEYLVSYFYPKEERKLNGPNIPFH